MWARGTEILIQWKCCPRAWNEVTYTSMPTDVKFVKSAVLAADYPDYHFNLLGKRKDRPEVAIAGRSNAGKSTFINCLTRSKIAKVSQEPGKTRLLNFFDIGDFYCLVDTPGYGFAARSGDEVGNWQEMLDTYFTTRENLRGLLLVMDIRRDWSDDEQQLLSFMNMVGKPCMVILTKADQILKKDIPERVRKIQTQAHIEKVWVTSSEKSEGVEDVEEYYFKNWIKPALNSKAVKK
jgi:GTP-binding protein